MPLEPKPNIKNLCDLFQRKALITSIDNCKQIKCVPSIRNKRAIDES